MTKYGQIGSAFNYIANFIVNGELVTPSSATITVQKNDGGATSVTDVALPISADSTSVIYQIPSSVNSATLPQEIRFITIKFVYQGAHYTINDVYLLRNSLLIPVTKDAVRALVTLTPSELPDDNIDLYYAYSQLDNALGNTLGSLISNGSIFLPNIQKALAARAALDSCKLIELMVYQSEQADNTIYKRFSKIDFESMMARLEAMYSEAIVEISEEDLSVPTLFIISSGTDALTGA